MENAPKTTKEGLKAWPMCTCGHSETRHYGSNGSGQCMYSDGPRGCGCKRASYSEKTTDSTDKDPTCSCGRTEADCKSRTDDDSD